VITVYEKPTCSTCRRVVVLLRERGVEFSRVNYFEAPLDARTLEAILDQAGLRPRDVVRMREPGASELSLDDDDAVIAALVEQPSLLQRPLVVRDDEAILARPPETVLELLR
jgi:arsenate reductase